MKNQDLWQPTRIILAKNGHGYDFNRRVVYPGSYHIAGIHILHYVPLIEKYCHGKLLDCGCGQAPWRIVYEKSVSQAYCIDWSDRPEVNNYLDEKIDLNEPFDLREKNFDCVLLTDVIAHISDPAQLIQSIHKHLRRGGHLVLTTPFVYWISEYPAEYFHATDAALKRMCEKAGFEIVHLEPYGGYPDVLLDTLNKGMISRFSNRAFRMLASVVKKTSWYKKANSKTRYSYPPGYTLVAKKK